MNETKSLRSEAKKNLAIGLAILVVGIAMLVTGIVVNYLTKAPYAKPKWYIYLLEIGGAALFLGSIGNLYFAAYHWNENHEISVFGKKIAFQHMNVKQMSVIAIFSALSVILYYFVKIPCLGFYPSWLDIQFSDVPALLTTFMYGPASGILVVLVRFFCKLPGTSTVCVGEFADVLIGTALCLTAGLIYKKHRSLKGALCSLAFGMLAGTVTACIANWLVLIPAYMYIAGASIDYLVGAMSYLGGVVTADNFMVYYLFVGVVPFNILRYAMVLLITLLLYKRLHIFINFVTKDKEDDFDEEEEIRVPEKEVTEPKASEEIANN